MVRGELKGNNSKEVLKISLHISAIEIGRYSKVTELFAKKAIIIHAVLILIIDVLNKALFVYFVSTSCNNHHIVTILENVAIECISKPHSAKIVKVVLVIRGSLANNAEIFVRFHLLLSHRVLLEKSTLLLLHRLHLQLPL